LLLTDSTTVKKIRFGGFFYWDGQTSGRAARLKLNSAPYLR
jgi:hypothetical protein